FVQPSRRALRRRRILLIDAHALPRAEDDPRHRMPAGWALSGVRPPTIGRDCRARRRERGSTHGCGGSALDGWLLGHGVQVLGPGGQPLQESLPSALAMEDRHVTLLDQERCLARDALRTARTSWSLVILEAPSICRGCASSTSSALVRSLSRAGIGCSCSARTARAASSASACSVRRASLTTPTAEPVCVCALSANARARARA